MISRLLATVFLLPLCALAQTQVPNVFEDGTPATAADVNENFEALESAIDSNDEDFELFRADTQLALPPSNCSTDQIIKWNGSAWVCSDPSGAAGPQGEKGDTGDTGPQGETGPAGSQGEKGDTGDTGPQGPIGLTGATGVKGDKGDTGEQGIQGEQGPPGADGVAAGLNCTTDQSIVYRGGAWVCSTPQVITYSVFAEGEYVVMCPEGKKVTGGGCVIDGIRDCLSTANHPLSDRSGWKCGAYGDGGFCQVNSAYAICQ